MDEFDSLSDSKSGSSHSDDIPDRAEFAIISVVMGGGRRARRRERRERAAAASIARRAPSPESVNPENLDDEQRITLEADKELSSEELSRKNYYRRRIFPMAYVAPIHRASNIRLAIKVNFLSNEDECVAVAKANRLEIYSQTPQGLALRYSKAVYGQIVMLEKLRPVSAPTDQIFVCTERHAFFTVSWDPVANQLKTERSFVDLADKSCRDIQTNDKCFIDSRRRFLTLALHEGIYTILPIHWKHQLKNQVMMEPGTLSEEVVPVRIGEIRVRSSTYLNYRTTSNKERVKIATLYQDNNENVMLKTRNVVPNHNLDYINLEQEKILLRDKLNPSASHLIPVSEPFYGLLVLAENSVVWIDDASDPETSVLFALPDATVWATWTEIKAHSWLLADEYGYLYHLMIEVDGLSQKPAFKYSKLGRTSRAACLLCLDQGRVLVGSHWGDSQMVELVSQSETESELRVVQTLTNIGPIVDFTVMDMGSRGGENQVNEFSSGQARLVTGSGAFQDGSLRSIRSGVGVEEIGSLDLNPDGTAKLPVATDMFHLTVPVENGSEDLLVVSYVNETRIFHFDQNGSVDEIQQMITNEPTIVAERLRGTKDRFIQCTDRSVAVYSTDSGSFKLTAHWQISGEHNIVAASISNRHAVLSVAGIELICLDISEAATQDTNIKELVRRKVDEQVSCINVPKNAPTYLLVGFWQSTSLSVLSLPDLNTRHITQIGTDSSAVPRSVLLTQVLPNKPPTLFLSLADGHIVTFDVDKANFGLSNRTTTILGSQQANLKVLPRHDGLFSVFAIAEHSTLIYGSENRLVFSAVTSEDATCICSFDSALYPDAVALATPNEIKIARVEREKTTHIQTLPVGETVRRISYSPDLHAFGLGTIRRTMSDSVELVQSFFKLVDEIAFGFISEYAMREEEIIESVCRVHVEENGKLRERFAVGTTYLPEDSDAENPRGRLIIFEVTGDKVLKVVTETKLKGACRALASIDGKIVAGLVKTLVIYAYDPTGLQKKAAYRCATAPIDIYVDEDKIVVSDIMKSVAVVKYTRGDAGGPDRLDEIARHYSLCWSTAVCPIDSKTILESDAEGNLLILTRDPNDYSQDQHRLDTISEMHLGEMVNKMRPIRVPASEDALVEPKAFVATVNGGIFMIGMITSGLNNELLQLQSIIAKHVRSPGNIPWTQWRALKNMVKDESEPLRFVDSDVIEAFLDCDKDTQEQIVKELTESLTYQSAVYNTVPKARALVETLRRMH